MIKNLHERIADNNIDILKKIKVSFGCLEIIWFDLWRISLINGSIRLKGSTWWIIICLNSFVFSLDCFLILFIVSIEFESNDGRWSIRSIESNGGFLIDCFTS